MLNQSENTTSPITSPIPIMKKELPKKRNKISMYLVLALIVVVAFAGIGISLRQYFIREAVAPTAPTESQASIDKVQDCSVSFDVAPPEQGINCIKQAYRDELSNVAGDYDLVQTQNSFIPGDIIVYSFLVTNTGEQETVITATDTLSINIVDDVYFSYDFLDSDCGADAYQDRTIICTTDSLLPGDSQTFTFRIQLSDQIDMNMILSNMVQITDGTLNKDCKVDVTIDIPTESYCNETCDDETDCVQDDHSCTGGVCRLTENPGSETCESEVVAYCGESCNLNTDCVQDDHTCYNNECRLSTNPTDINCRPPVEQPTPTPETVAYCGEYCSTNADCIQGDHICYFNQCRLAEYPDRNDCTAPQQVIVKTYVEPTPTIGCNESCLTNRDCSNNDQICYEGSCRLGSYPASTSCTVPTTPISPSQPKMPEELPQSGSDDLINWIKAGIGILGAGALLLLL